MSTLRHWLFMAVLSISGGVIFLLPFLQQYYYIPLTQALNINNTQLGSLMSVFGLVSVFSYLPGGWLADHVSPRKLFTLSLLSTGIAGFYFATFPAYEISLAIHAFWGFSVTLLFWGAMICATRNWAPPHQQGRAFGVLEMGRGLTVLLCSTALLFIFVSLGSGDYGLSVVVKIYSAIYLVLGVLAWFLLEDKVADRGNSGGISKFSLGEVISVLKMPAVWLITIVVLSGYCARWGLVRFTPYATDVFTLSVTIGVAIAVGTTWLRPVAAIVAGFIGDRFGVARSIIWLFAILAVSFFVAAMLPGVPTLVPAMLVITAITAIAVFAMRGIYFALLEEGVVPLAVTGTATGVISTIGFTPDIFMPLLGGVLTDNFPGAEGYRYFFFTTATICGFGLTASLLFYLKYSKNRQNGLRLGEP